MPKVTVYVVSHNYGSFLMDAVESVLRQTYDDWEMLIIDDKSTDNTREVMEYYKGDARIRLIHTAGIGLNAVCNLALKEAKGKYIIRLDGDDIFDENALLVLSNYLERNPEFSLVFPDYYLMDEFGEVFGQERRKKLQVANHLLDAPANGACTLTKVEVLKDLGGYREDLRAQDGFDLWSKIVAKYKCANVNLPLFYYRRHGNNLTNKAGHILSARRQIKKDSIFSIQDQHRPFIAVIPCRKNYDFCVDLWDQKLNGKTLLEYSIETCLASKLLDYVFVACDNDAVKKTIEKYDDKRLRFYLRKPESTLRSRSIAGTLDEIAVSVDPERKGVTLVSYVQAPFVTTDTMEESLFTLLMNQTDSTIGVEEVKSNLLRRTPFGLQYINPPSEFVTDFDVVYAEANIAMATKNINLLNGSLTGPKIGNFIVSHDECMFIDNARKLSIARIITDEKHPL